MARPTTKARLAGAGGRSNRRRPYSLVGKRQ